jgi:hypothetical protein
MFHQEWIDGAALIFLVSGNVVRGAPGSHGCVCDLHNLQKSLPQCTS